MKNTNRTTTNKDFINKIYPNMGKISVFRGCDWVGCGPMILHKDITLYKTVNIKDEFCDNYYKTPKKAILELWVPAGSYIYSHSPIQKSHRHRSDRKVRVSQAIPVGVIEMSIDTQSILGSMEDKQTILDDAEYQVKYKKKLRSDYDPRFFYEIGKPSFPRYGFDLTSYNCGGIHGFFNIQDAIGWQLEIR